MKYEQVPGKRADIQGSPAVLARTAPVEGLLTEYAIEFDAGSGGEDAVAVLPACPARSLQNTCRVIVMEGIFARRVRAVYGDAFEAVYSGGVMQMNCKRNVSFSTSSISTSFLSGL